jgi:hypothetical protein
MGYYTYFRIESIDGEKEQIDKFYKLLDDHQDIDKFIAGNGELFYENYIKSDLEGLDFSYIGSSLNVESAKWYEFNDDMTKLSKLFPTLTFIIRGEGEESEDVWKAKVKNGEISIVMAELTFPEFSF